jgi:hypothetical protein
MVNRLSKLKSLIENVFILELGSYSRNPNRILCYFGEKKHFGKLLIFCIQEPYAKISKSLSGILTCFHFPTFEFNTLTTSRLESYMTTSSLVSWRVSN